MTTFIVIPCKALAEGKSRLACDIDSSTRAALCASFLRRTLTAAMSLVPVQRVRLVTGDPGATAVAQEHGVPVITEHGPGLNEALDLARNVIVGTGSAASQALILPIDCRGGPGPRWHVRSALPKMSSSSQMKKTKAPIFWRYVHQRCRISRFPSVPQASRST